MSGVFVFHFPFAILGLTFVIAGTARRAAMTNVKPKMANGK
jgi:hypothetical protein